MTPEITKIVCLTPVFNDWESLYILIKNLESQIQAQPNLISLKIIAINDGSSESVARENLQSTIPIEIVSLKKNVGHQRAIAIGLQYIYSLNLENDFVVVMDCDGEDKPEDVFQLVKKCQALEGKKIIFAQRKKRQESILFKTGYFFYKHIFHWLTGQKINFGNFSCVPQQLMKKIVVQDSLWNHFSGSVIQSRIPYDRLLLDRGKRYHGVSKMNFTSLILHGLSSISVYFDFLSVRILKLSVYGVLVCFLSVIGVIYIKFFTENPVPGWASSLILIFFMMILQLSSVTLIVLLMQLSARKNIKTPSVTIYKKFIDEIKIY